jgi:phosphinothricin acetyltransferase
MPDGVGSPGFFTVFPLYADGMHVRRATVADAEAIRRIYNAEVLGSTTTFDLVARSVDDQREWLAGHSGPYPAVVAECDGHVAGFGSLSPYRSRPAYATTVEDSVYVERDKRARGVGRRLLSELVSVGAAHGFHAVIARIADGQEASIALHRSCGFEQIGVEREVGRKFGQWLDVVLMERLLVD